VLHEGRVTARGPAARLDLEHELMSPPSDGHVHDEDDARAHGATHTVHRHATEGRDDDEHPRGPREQEESP
jgi:hypothetical protein